MNRQTDWLPAPPPQQGMRRYVATIRERARIVLGAVALTLIAALAYIVIAPTQYEAEAKLLVTPLSSDNALFTTLGVITESSDPALDVETAAQLADSPEVAEEAAAALGGTSEPETILDQVDVQPVPDSNIISITATGDSPKEARDLANAFADAAVQHRSDIVHRRAEEVLPGIQATLDQASGEAAKSLGEVVAQLTALSQGSNPTVQLEAAATTPTSPSSPRVGLIAVAALVTGLAIGIVAAFARHELDPHLRREEQLRTLFNLPVLARVPADSRRGSALLSSKRAPPRSQGAYRNLRAALIARGNGALGPRSILVTGASPTDEKTESTINLAVTLVSQGSVVILMDTDLRNRGIEHVLGVRPRIGLEDVLRRNAGLAQALLTVSGSDSRLRLLLPSGNGATTEEVLFSPATGQLISDARGLADYLVIDAPSLPDAVNALPLARSADAVVVTAKLGVSRLDRLRELAEVLAADGVQPAGVIVVEP